MLTSAVSPASLGARGAVCYCGGAGTAQEEPSFFCFMPGLTAHTETSHKFSIPTLERENRKPQEEWIGLLNIWNSLPILSEEASVRTGQDTVA